MNKDWLYFNSVTVEAAYGSPCSEETQKRTYDIVGTKNGSPCLYYPGEIQGVIEFDIAPSCMINEVKFNGFCFENIKHRFE